MSQESFSAQIEIMFTKDGKQAIVQTIDETWVIELEKDPFKDKYLCASVKFLKGKEVSLFRHGESSILFCEKNESDLQV